MSFKRRRPPTSGNPTSTPGPLPEGVKISPNSAQPVTSWGHRSIDSALSGGLPLHTLTIITEDAPSAYYRPITSYVVAQGLENGHTIAIASFDSDPERLLHSIPAAVKKQDTIHGYSAAIREQTEMKIAWRYQNSHRSASSPNVIHGHSASSYTSDFDLSQAPTISSSAPVSLLPTDPAPTDPTPLLTLLSNLKLHLQKSTSQSRVSRILITGLSPDNPCSFPSSCSDISLTHFLVHLRSLLLEHCAIAVVTCSRDTPNRIQAVCADIWLELNSFEGHGGGIAGLGSDWLGVMVVRKIYRGYGRIGKGVGDVWVFKRGRRKYVFERATAAPDDDVGQGPDESQATSSAPGQTKKSEVDF